MTTSFLKYEEILYSLESASRYLNIDMQLVDQEGNNVFNIINSLSSFYHAMDQRQKADLKKRFICVLHNLPNDSSTQFYEFFPGLKIGITPLPIQDKLYLLSGLFLSTGDVDLLRSSLGTDLGTSVKDDFFEKYPVLNDKSRAMITSELDLLQQHLAVYIRNIHSSNELKKYREILNAIQTVFLQSVSFEEKFSKTASLLRELSPFSLMGLATPLAKNKYKVEYVYGEQKDCWKEYEFDVSEGFFGWVLMSRSASQWNDVTQDPRYYSIRSVSKQLKSMSIFPIIYGNDNIGLLFFASEEINLFSKDWISNVDGILSHFRHELITMSNISKVEYMSKKISILMGISQLLTTDIDPKRILSIVVDFLMNMEKVDQSFGVIVNNETVEYLVGRGITVEQIIYYCKQFLAKKAEEVVTEQQMVFPIRINNQTVGWFFVGSKEKINHKDVMFTNTLVSVACTVLKSHITFDSRPSFDPVEMLVTLLKIKNKDAYEHSVRVKTWVELICAHLNVDEETKSSAIKSALLHEIGLLVTDKRRSHYDKVLQHSDDLVSLSIEVLSVIPAFEKVAPIIRAQNEYYDGSGPNGLRGDEIPYASKILNIANQFDVSMGEEDPNSDHVIKILLEMEHQAGNRFDPEVLDAFSLLLRRRFAVTGTNLQLNSPKKESNTPVNILSPRELEVILLMVRGLSNKEIAGSLYISEHTVKNHISNIFQKLNLSDRTSVVSYAYKNGLMGN